MKRFCLFEDNAGGAHFFELIDEKVVYQHSYPEFGAQLTEDIRALADTDPVLDWEGNEVDEIPELYNELVSFCEQRNGSVDDITDQLGLQQ